MELSKGRILLIMTSLVLSSVMASLDSSFAPIAIPDMIDKLDSSTSEIVWVALGYLIAASGPMLLAAKMADGIGHARFFQIGTLIYAIAMIACSWAPDANTLISIRFIQGFGMALFLPTTFAIASAVFGTKKRGTALGILQAANAFGFVMGPIFAGWLLDAYDWTAIFWSRIPFAILAIILAFLAFGSKNRFQFSERQKTYDYLGALFLTLALFGILFGCNKLPVEDNHLDPLVWIIFVLGFVSFFLFIRQERKHPDPLIDLDLFTKSNAFTKASIAFISVFASFPVYLFILPIVMISGLEMKAWDAGLALCLAAVATLLISPMAGKASDRFGPEKLCMAGALLTGIGYVSLLVVLADSSVVAILPAMVLIGGGTGLFFAPNNNLMLSSAPQERAGMVSGLFGTLRQSGYALGFAITASLFTAIQNWFDLDWAYSSINEMLVVDAMAITDIYHQGSQWSPEMLVFILHTGVLLCSSILIITFINSLPKIKLSLNRQALICVASLLVAFFSMGFYSLTNAPAAVVVNSSDSIELLESKTEEHVLQAFGMQSRVFETLTPAQTKTDDAELSDIAGGTSNKAYAMRCEVCHGASLEGIDGLGIGLQNSNFLIQANLEQIVHFLKSGRMPNAEDSISGGVMPAFAWLQEEELEEIASYVKSVNENQTRVKAADLILLNAKVYTVDSTQPWASAVAIENGQITYVGDDQGARALVDSTTQVVNLKGRMILPGFHDIHVHPVHSGVSYQQCNLFDIKGLKRLLDKIKECTLANPENEWIVGGGWTVPDFAPSGLPDKKLLDEIVSDRPVSLKSSDGHSLWVNSKALELAGITAATPDPENGRIDRYPNSQEPSGSLQEDSAIMLVMDLEPELTTEDLINGLKYSRDLFHSLGITGVQDAILKLKPGDAYYGLDAYNYLDNRNELNLHVVTALFWENSKPLDQQLPQFLKIRQQQQTNGNVKATSIKIWQDGVIETQTAALLEPYSDRSDGYRGDLQNTPDNLNTAVVALDAAGFQIHFHAIGDRAIRVSLDALEEAINSNGTRDSRHHLSHIELFNPADIPRFAAMNVIANFQPLWAIQDEYITDLTWPRLGEERSKWLYPIGSMQRTGAKVGFGSDWYVTSVNPLDGIETAVTRLDPNGLTDVPLGQNEEISLAQAIENYTLNSAYVNFLDHRVGSVEVGKQADLVILDRNLFAIPTSEINEAKVIATLFEGRLVYGTLKIQ